MDEQNQVSLTDSKSTNSKRRIHVVINPAAGPDTPVLATLNSIFQPMGVEWSVSVTQKAGDARHQAEEAVAAGVDVVAAYGGDGTVAEVAKALINTDTALAILPGGTANVMAHEMHIPLNLTEACTLACRPDAHIRSIDVGEVNDYCFLLRVGIGTEAKITEKADRELKNSMGFLAYVWAAVQNLAEPEQAAYHLTIDNEEFEMNAITCGIINSGKFGLGNLQILPNVQVDDGLLEVILIQNTNLPALAKVIGGIMGIQEGNNPADNRPVGNSGTLPIPAQFGDSMKVWQGKEIKVRVDPAQTVQYDGELLEAQGSEITCRVVPRALRVIVPTATP